jgi:hypothetical protein
MAVTFADVESFPSPAMPLVTPASAIFISLSISIGDSPIVPPSHPLGSPSSLVGWSSRHVDRVRVLQLPGRASSNRPEVLEVPFRGQFDARNQMLVSACRSLSWLLSYFAVSVFAKTFW